MSKKWVSKKVRREEAIPAKVIALKGRTGETGGVTRIVCRILDREGNETNRIIRRVVKGPIRVGDILLILGAEKDILDVK